MEITLIIMAIVAALVDVIVELGRKGLATLKAKAAKTETKADDQLIESIEDIIRKIVDDTPKNDE